MHACTPACARVHKHTHKHTQMCLWPRLDEVALFAQLYVSDAGHLSPEQLCEYGGSVVTSAALQCCGYAAVRARHESLIQRFQLRFIASTERKASGFRDATVTINRVRVCSREEELE